MRTFRRACGRWPSARCWRTCSASRRCNWRAEIEERVRFDGTAGEYARLWVANLLLTLSSAGLYAPVARRRTMRFFRAHTRLSGSALEWHPAPRGAVLWFALLLAGYIVFKTAVQLRDDLLATILLLAGTVVAPFAWAGAMRIRLASIGWRGLRPRFAADWRELVRASWPLYATALVWAAELTVGTWASASSVAIATVILLLRLEYEYKKLLLARTRIGELSAQWSGTFPQSLRIWAETSAVLLLTLALLGPPLAWALHAGRKVLPSAQEIGDLALPVAIALGAGTLLLVGVLTAPARAWREAALFRWLWNDVRVGEEARVTCDLQPRAYMRLRTRNLLLSLATLGLYHPHAAIAAYRMKVESIAVHMKKHPEEPFGPSG